MARVLHAEGCRKEWRREAMRGGQTAAQGRIQNDEAAESLRKEGESLTENTFRN